MAKRTKTTSDIWHGDIEDVKARVKAVLTKTIQVQRASADDAGNDDDPEGYEACDHAAGVVEWIRAQLFGE